MTEPDHVSPPARRMRAADRAADLLGVDVVAAGDGESIVEMTAGPDTDNGLGICHGGFLFTLADMAMAYASNGGAVRSVATGGTVEFLKAVAVGTRLRARCTTPQRRGRNSVHDVEVVEVLDAPEAGTAPGATGDAVSTEGDAVVVFRGRTLSLGEQPTS